MSGQASKLLLPITASTAGPLCLREQGRTGTMGLGTAEERVKYSRGGFMRSQVRAKKRPGDTLADCLTG